MIKDEESKNEDMLTSFAEYCWGHPEEKFWQALRKWASSHDLDTNFILTAEEFDVATGQFIGINDTFYKNDYKIK